jgi:hypothetical protein
VGEDPQGLVERQLLPDHHRRPLCAAPVQRSQDRSGAALRGAPYRVPAVAGLSGAGTHPHLDGGALHGGGRPTVPAHRLHPRLHLRCRAGGALARCRPEAGPVSPAGGRVPRALLPPALACSSGPGVRGPRVAGCSGDGGPSPPGHGGAPSVPGGGRSLAGAPGPSPEGAERSFPIAAQADSARLLRPLYPYLSGRRTGRCSRLRPRCPGCQEHGPGLQHQGLLPRARRGQPRARHRAGLPALAGFCAGVPRGGASVPRRDTGAAPHLQGATPGEGSPQVLQLSHQGRSDATAAQGCPQAAGDTRAGGRAPALA